MDLTSGKVGLANLVDTHNHLIYFADIVVSAFANCCRVNFAICRFSLPVISQEIFSAKNVVIVRRKTYRTGWKKSFCEIIAGILVISQCHVSKCCVGSEHAFCDFSLNSRCCISHVYIPPLRFCFLIILQFWILLYPPADTELRATPITYSPALATAAFPPVVAVTSCPF